jgi:hypothetical protein
MEKILLQLQDDLQSIKVGQVEMRAEIHAIKSDIDELKAEDEGRDLLGVVRVIQNYPKVSGVLSLVLLVGTMVTGSVVLSRYKLDHVLEAVENRYLSGPYIPPENLQPAIDYPEE